MCQRSKNMKKKAGSGSGSLYRLSGGVLTGWCAVTGASTPALAQTDSGVEALDTVVVIGTRRVDRSVQESNVAVDVVGGDALGATGYTALSRALVEQVPSFNSPPTQFTDGSDHVQLIALRGLSPDQTLVLVNGKRRHASSLINVVGGTIGIGASTVDLNTIPMAAIERVEVLRDGAAAQYGSDAIAGVINLVLKSADSGGDLTVSASQYQTRFNPKFRGPYAGNALPRNESLSDGETYTVSANAGLPLADGFINLTAEYQDRGPTNRAGLDPQPNYPALPDGSPDPRERTFNRLNHRIGQADTQDLELFYNSRLPVGETVELYSFGSYNDRSSDNPGFYRHANEPSRNNTNLYPDGFLPFIDADIKDYSVAAGATAELGAWSSDFSLVYGSNEYDIGVYNSLNAALGASSPTEFDIGGFTYDQWVANLDFSRQVDIGPFASPLSIAFGAEYREEKYRIVAGEPASYVGTGSQVFPGFKPEAAAATSGANRSAYGVYLELDVDVTDKWNATLAGRFEDYNDFGSTTNGKFATRYELTDAIALRGSVSTGFRAPTLQQNYFGAQQTIQLFGFLLELFTLPVNSAVAQTLGATRLEPEESVNISAGLVLRPLERLDVTLDFYHIEIDNKISLTEQLSGNQQALIDAGVLGPDDFALYSYFVNGVDVEARGFDLIATYRPEGTVWGAIRYTLGFNYSENEVTGVPVVPAAQAGLEPEEFWGGQRRIAIETGQPDTKLNLGIDWELAAFEATLRVTRYGKVQPFHFDIPGTFTLRPKWIADLEGRYNFTEHVQVALGANNLFDTYPDTMPLVVDSQDGITAHSALSPFGSAGRMIYARGSYRF
jgi:iron complex outermembrane recepter protein